MKKLTVLTLALVLASFSFVGCTKPEGGGLGGSSLDTSKYTNKYVDIAYADKSQTQKLDIYLPNEGEGPFPVIVAIHGGAFKMGSKTGGDLTSMFESLNRGYAVVAVDYRLSGEAIFPAAVNDIKASIRFIRQNASDYNLNPDKIALWGDSAGGNLASIAGTTGGTDELYDPSLGYENISDDVTAVVDWFGPINFLEMDSQFEESGITPKFGKTSSDSSPESAYIGNLITNAKDIVAKSNPETYISKDDPAFLIEHGTKDANVPVQQSINFAQKLQSVLGNEKVELILLEGASHGGVQFEDNSNLDKVFEFLDKHMK
ncbi:Acetyl esterase/lipase [Acetoanaerobium noterae]|uniref:Acetyl esterase/lipase n=1 Tax=Acetoanaerobium noterae TaxID=745369 RepID=A0A1T5AN85_9FIRM|nr:alpha/beta hydrolase [Acetoanaerobium noterae]SKB36491.1 Acetyl esterase/lipase [Acetoanaerobium noterae]